jgi:predicted RNA binding protein with dsRBD fold (UPF0201 family)
MLNSQNRTCAFKYFLSDAERIMPLVTITCRCYPTEDAAKVERAVLNLFPESQVERSADAILATAEDLERFKEIIRNHRILDTTRSVMLRGSTGRRTRFLLNKQVAFVGKVSFLEGRTALGGMEVTVEAEDLDSLIDEVAPITVNGEEVTR